MKYYRGVTYNWITLFQNRQVQNSDLHLNTKPNDDLTTGLPFEYRISEYWKIKVWYSDPHSIVLCK